MDDKISPTQTESAESSLRPPGRRQRAIRKRLKRYCRIIRSRPFWASFAIAVGIALSLSAGAEMQVLATSLLAGGEASLYDSARQILDQRIFTFSSVIFGALSLLALLSGAAAGVASYRVKSPKTLFIRLGLATFIAATVTDIWIEIEGDYFSTVSMLGNMLSNFFAGMLLAAFFCGVIVAAQGVRFDSIKQHRTWLRFRTAIPLFLGLLISWIEFLLLAYFLQPVDATFKARLPPPYEARVWNEHRPPESESDGKNLKRDFHFIQGSPQRNGTLISWLGAADDFNLYLSNPGPTAIGATLKILDGCTVSRPEDLKKALAQAENADSLKVSLPLKITTHGDLIEFRATAENISSLDYKHTDVGWFSARLKDGAHSLTAFASSTDTLTGHTSAKSATYLISFMGFKTLEDYAKTNEGSRRVFIEAPDLRATLGLATDSKLLADAEFECRARQFRNAGSETGYLFEIASPLTVLVVQTERNEVRLSELSDVNMDIKIGGINGWLTIEGDQPPLLTRTSNFGYVDGLLLAGNFESLSVNGHAVSGSDIQAHGDIYLHIDEAGALEVSGKAHTLRLDRIRKNSTRWEMTPVELVVVGLAAVWFLLQKIAVLLYAASRTTSQIRW